MGPPPPSPRKKSKAKKSGSLAGSDAGRKKKKKNATGEEEEEGGGGVVDLVPEDAPLDHVHDVEPSADHRNIVADAVAVRVRHVGGTQRGEDPRLAQHALFRSRRREGRPRSAGIALRSAVAQHAHGLERHQSAPDHLVEVRQELLDLLLAVDDLDHHRHVNHDAVAFADTLALQAVGKLAQVLAHPC